MIKPVTPDWESMLANLRRTGTPRRVFYFEHGIADTILDGLDKHFRISAGMNRSSPTFAWDRHVAIHRFLGMEFFRVFPNNARMTVPKRDGAWTEEGHGPIGSWETFDSYDWPNPNEADYGVLEHLDHRLPENMRAFHVLDFWEVAKDLLGFEQLCLLLYDTPELVTAVFDRVGEIVEAYIRALCDFESLAAVYLGDDLGFKTSTFLAPDDLRRLVIPWHKRFAAIAHEHGKLFFFHSCGQMYDLIDDYIDVVGIDAKHSFEDAVLPVTEAKKRYGDRLTLLGGIDVDLLARADEAVIRARTRGVLEICLPSGGYFLGSGNWVSDYIPIDHYLWMLDEARRFCA